jgi:hypothetical protein
MTIINNSNRLVNQVTPPELKKDKKDDKKKDNLAMFPSGVQQQAEPKGTTKIGSFFASLLGAGQAKPGQCNAM